jgi:hypothetical protein
VSEDPGALFKNISSASLSKSSEKIKTSPFAKCLKLWKSKDPGIKTPLGQSTIGYSRLQVVCE